jgi:hypothetical protein
MADPTNPPPRPPGPWDHEDPPADIRPGAIPKKPKVPKPIRPGGFGRDGAPIPPGYDDAAPCPVCISAPCGCDHDCDDGEPSYACIAEEE